MDKAILYQQLKKTEVNKDAISSIQKFSKANENLVIYLISAPLGESYHYDYESNVIVILSPGYKIMFLDLANNEREFSNYYEDFISDLGSISSKYKYQDYIGRTRLWKNDMTSRTTFCEDLDIEELFEENKLPTAQKRKSELLISLLTGCINDISKIGLDQPQSKLEYIKKKIILFDAEQTRFIYKEYLIKKIISVQGLSGTGKTELLLHKLKDLYTKGDFKIFLTCHNIALAKTLKKRIPPFFDLMKVDKQIKWNENLWVNHAWGSLSNQNSGLYSYICHFYNITFYRYSRVINYKFIFKQALKEIEAIPKKDFKYCFDYILVDESQDFPDEFFDLCKKIVRYNIYSAGDVFQDIFDSVKTNKRGVDIVLNRCYRTDPRTLMFAHSIGLGLLEDKKLNWFDSKEWENLGYKVKENPDKNSLYLSRYPIQRFDEIKIDESVKIYNDTSLQCVGNIIQQLRTENSDLSPEDIAIIILDDNNYQMYAYIDGLCYYLAQRFNWPSIRGYETKGPEKGYIYITNTNNVKGLEFPFVICISSVILDSHRYRNTLYTMLTRSFLQSFLLVRSKRKLGTFSDGLKQINKNLFIETSIPSQQEIEQIQQTILQYQEDKNISYQEFLENIFNELKITDKKTQQLLTDGLNNTKFDKFDKDKTVEYINANRKFYE